MNRKRRKTKVKPRRIAINVNERAKTVHVYRMVYKPPRLAIIEIRGGQNG